MSYGRHKKRGPEGRINLLVTSWDTASDDQQPALVHLRGGPIQIMIDMLVAANAEAAS
jgi:hypothetical protein